MLIDDKNVVVLYLEDWQKRMIKDFLGVECDYWEVPVEEQEGSEKFTPVILYAVVTHQPTEYKKMYLTDWQMRELRDEAGITCDFVELKKESPFVKYGVSTK
jgi:hypothetical protein